MGGLFITFEGTEGSGKSTQLQRLAQRLQEYDRTVVTLREPGGTSIGEEIRQTLIQSAANGAMCAETELLLVNASRAQLVRETIRPALDRGEIVLCDRFYDSTIAYQGYGRAMDMALVERVIEVAVGETRPDLTLLLRVPIAVSEERRRARNHGGQPARDRFEGEDRAFFERVEQGFAAIESSGGMRVRTIDATQSIDDVHAEVWRWVEQLICAPLEQGERAVKTIGELRRNVK